MSAASLLTWAPPPSSRRFVTSASGQMQGRASVNGRWRKPSTAGSSSVQVSETRLLELPDRPRV